jgi:hypothetical protein
VPRTTIAARVAGELGVDLDPVFVLQVDCGQSNSSYRMGTMDCAEDRPYHQSAYFFRTGLCASPDKMDFKDPLPEVDQIISESMHVAIGAVLMYAARPEIVVEYQLPRAERYKQKGERKHIRRMRMPTVKVVRPPHHGDSVGAGSPKAHHFRAGSLHTLRHPRYMRNSDGSPRVISVPPCEIHAEQRDRLPAA